MAKEQSSYATMHVTRDERRWSLVPSSDTSLSSPLSLSVLKPTLNGRKPSRKNNDESYTIIGKLLPTRGSNLLSPFCVVLHRPTARSRALLIERERGLANSIAYFQFEIKLKLMEFKWLRFNFLSRV